MKQSFSGKLQGISLESFLQMASMERLTCTLTVTTDAEVGYLYLLSGELISAKTATLQNLDAAHRILSWENAVIEIEDSCEKTENEINQPLMNLMMVAAHLKDESGTKPQTRAPDAIGETVAEPESPPVQEPRIPTAPPEDYGRIQEAKTRENPVEPEETSPGRKWKILIISIVALLGIGAGIGGYLFYAEKNRAAYQTLMARVSETETPEQKIQLLTAFIESSPGRSYAEKALDQIDGLKNNIISREYEKLEGMVEPFIQSNAFEEAIAVYDKFQKMNPGSEFRRKIAAKKQEWAGRMESRDFEQMLARTSAQGPERFEAYLSFLAQYPKTRHHEEISLRISRMEEEYYSYLERQIVEMKASGSWRQALTLIQTFLDTYPRSLHTNTLKRFKKVCEENIQADETFEQLVLQAEQFGRDWESALAVFSNFLKDNPRTPAEERIKGEISRLTGVLDTNRRAAAVNEISARLASLPRFIVAGDGETFRDENTGLTWRLLDSHTELNKCLSYKGAQSYIDNFKTDDNWRLPSPEEVLSLYTGEAPFPYISSQWYWTAVNFKSYKDQWTLDVEVIVPTQPKGAKQVSKESWECGSVRPVRGGNNTAVPVQINKDQAAEAQTRPEQNKAPINPDQTMEDPATHEQKRIMELIQGLEVIQKKE